MNESQNAENMTAMLFLALASCAEISGRMRDELIKNGFTREEAVAMSERFLHTLLTESLKGNK